MSLDGMCYNPRSESAGSSESGIGRQERSLRVWLAGSRSFGAEALEVLDDLPGVEVVGVTCPPGDRLADSSRPACTGCCPNCLSYTRTDLIVSAHNYQHIGPEARAATAYGAIGYHPSLLPRHRGPNAVEWAIDIGDPIAGGTVYLLDDGYDTGPVIAQDFCHVVPGWTASDLWRNQLFPMGIRLLSRVVYDLSRHREFILWPQDERVATQC